MTNTEIQEFVKKSEKIIKEIASSKEKSQKALFESGIYTKTGKLKKLYNGKFQ